MKGGEGPINQQGWVTEGPGEETWEAATSRDLEEQLKKDTGALGNEVACALWPDSEMTIELYYRKRLLHLIQGPLGCDLGASEPIPPHLAVNFLQCPMSLPQMPGIGPSLIAGTSSLPNSWVNCPFRVPFLFKSFCQGFEPEKNKRVTKQIHEGNSKDPILKMVWSINICWVN